MLLDELQQVLELLVGAINAHDGGCDWSLSIKAAQPVLAYAHACTSTELEPAVACIVAEVCCSLLRTMEGCLLGSVDDPTTSTVPRPVEHSGAAELDMAGSADAAASVEIMHQCHRTVTGSLSDVAGLESVKAELEQAVMWPLRMPCLFVGYRQPPRSFLLVGPPGTGKTMLVEKLASQCGITLLALSPSCILSKWAGESEKAVRSVFAAASAMQPSMIFIDEVDGMAAQRDAGDDAATRRLLTELLIQMTTVTSQDVFVFACTNRIQDCDKALLRRFERRVFIPLPDFSSRQSFLALALARPEMEHSIADEDVTEMAKATDGYSCSDLAAVCRHAAMAPVRELMAQGHPVTRQQIYEDSSKARDALCQEEDTSRPDLALHLSLRKLQPADFMAAIRECRPSDEDCHTFAH
eukprot:364943-Chlamydomonas_euryale.AAC.22